MPPSPRHRLHAIDAELRAHRDVTLAAVAELAEVRRRQTELHDMEAALVVTVDARRRRMDGLLDQRLDIVVGGGGGDRSLHGHGPPGSIARGPLAGSS